MAKRLANKAQAAFEDSSRDVEHLIAIARSLGRPWSGEEYAWEELEFLVRVFGGGGDAFRFLCLPPSGIDDLDPLKGLGRLWTEDLSAPYTEALNIPWDADDTWRFVVLKTEVSLVDIDLAETLSVRSAIPWEKEVVI
ncbi:hypothetical protein [Roseibium sp. RKSG952]|uniref:hypothetical protein n=1 Tax=Roseibium sp. RKSG952 TaxID=2529384 RepID=UPI0012BB9629|nr:hypothetical protein [Roseibium sp. RKSG952]MTH95068.1 hypothetical protein [Roseibium sp. RKSG952]